MKKYDQVFQSERTLMFCRSKDSENAEGFVQASFTKIRKALGGNTAVPFLAFCNLNPESFTAGEASFFEAGFVVNSVPKKLSKEILCQTLPPARVLSLTTEGVSESRSAVHLEMFLYAQALHLKLKNTIYEYHFPGDAPIVVYTAEIL